jgi:HD superfamily phosphohydrolase
LNTTDTIYCRRIIPLPQQYLWYNNTLKMENKFIKDPIHRFVYVPELCMRFIDTEQFQRLRYIKALGNVHYVFPSATHTRFEHCIGTMHLCKEFCDQLPEIDEKTAELIMLAGLLHDVGHRALSHVADHMFHFKTTHEENSVKIMREINDQLELLDANEVDMVEAMILGTPIDERKYLYQIVADYSYRSMEHDGQGAVDADRMDYLSRDAHHTGLSSFQADYIIKCAYVDKETNNLMFKEKAAYDIKSMLLTRRTMYKNVYRHATVQIIDDLFIKTAKQIDLSEEDFYDDISLMSKFRSTSAGKKMLKELSERKLYTMM